MYVCCYILENWWEYLIGKNKVLAQMPLKIIVQQYLNWMSTMPRFFVIVPDKQIIGRELLHNWLVRVDMDLVTFCDMDVEFKRA